MKRTRTPRVAGAPVEPREGNAYGANAASKVTFRRWDEARQTETKGLADTRQHAPVFDSEVRVNVSYWDVSTGERKTAMVPEHLVSIVDPKRRTAAGVRTADQDHALAMQRGPADTSYQDR